MPLFTVVSQTYPSYQSAIASVEKKLNIVDEIRTMPNCFRTALNITSFLKCCSYIRQPLCSSPPQVQLVVKNQVSPKVSSFSLLACTFPVYERLYLMACHTIRVQTEGYYLMQRGKKINPFLKFCFCSQLIALFYRTGFLAHVSTF